MSPSPPAAEGRAQTDKIFVTSGRRPQWPAVVARIPRSDRWFVVAVMFVMTAPLLVRISAELGPSRRACSSPRSLFARRCAREHCGRPARLAPKRTTRGRSGRLAVKSALAEYDRIRVTWPPSRRRGGRADHTAAASSGAWRARRRRARARPRGRPRRRRRAGAPVLAEVGAARAARTAIRARSERPGRAHARGSRGPRRRRRRGAAGALPAGRGGRRRARARRDGAAALEESVPPGCGRDARGHARGRRRPPRPRARRRSAG